MNTNFVYTFKTRNAAINHLRALAQLSCSISNSNLPIKDFYSDYARMYDSFAFLRRGLVSSLYFGFREYGFEFDDTFDSFNSRMMIFSDCIEAYILDYNDGYFELRSYGSYGKFDE